MIPITHCSDVAVRENNSRGHIGRKGPQQGGSLGAGRAVSAFGYQVSTVL